MADREGYVLIDRNILNWKWWQKHNTLVVFIWLLLRANFHDSYFCGVKIKRGQVATTIENIQLSNKLTRQEVKTALVHIKSTGEITITRYPKFLVITIVNYIKYQNPNIKSNNDQTSIKHQSNINQTYTKKNNTDNTDKKDKKGRPGRSAPPPPSGKNDSHLRLRPDEGTVEDIPETYRSMFSDFAEYWRWRNQ